MHANDPTLKSFVAVAADSHFPIQNLPFGIFSTTAKPVPRVGMAIGDLVLDLAMLEQRSLLKVADIHRAWAESLERCSARCESPAAPR